MDGPALFRESNLPVLNLRARFVQKRAAVPGGLAFKAHRFLYHSTLGIRVIKKKKLPTGGEQPRLTWAQPRQVAKVEDLQGYLAHKKRTTKGAASQPYCRVLGGRGFS